MSPLPPYETLSKHATVYFSQILANGNIRFIFYSFVFVMHMAIKLRDLMMVYWQKHQVPDKTPEYLVFSK